MSFSTQIKNIGLIWFLLTCWKLADVVADTNEHACSFQVVSPFHMDLNSHKNTDQGLWPASIGYIDIIQLESEIGIQGVNAD